MLNLNKPYGKICPPENGVAFVQGGKYFNGAYQEVDEKGNVIEGSAPKPKAKEAAPSGLTLESRMPVAVLLTQAPKMPFGTFKKLAKEWLGDNCPSLKADIVKALEGVAGAAKSADAAPAALPDKGATPGAKPKSDKPTVASNGVDLVAWVDKRINQQYLMGDVFFAIKQLHHKVVANERDAVNFLVDEGVVEPQYARVAGATAVDMSDAE